MFVEENASATARSVTLSFGNLGTVTINQSGAPPWTILSPASRETSWAAQNVNLTVQTNSAAPWSVSENVQWIRAITQGGQGCGLVTLALDENPTVVPRSASVTVAGQVHTITQRGQPTTFAQWIWASTILGTKADPLEDPDSDGLPNLVEYVLCGNPNVSDTHLAPCAVEGGRFTLTYKRLKSATDVIVRTMVSSDLQTWTTVGVTEEIIADDGVRLTICAGVPSNAEISRFLRVVVESIP